METNQPISSLIAFYFRVPGCRTSVYSHKHIPIAIYTILFILSSQCSIKLFVSVLHCLHRMLDDGPVTQERFERSVKLKPALRLYEGPPSSNWIGRNEILGCKPHIVWVHFLVPIEAQSFRQLSEKGRSLPGQKKFEEFSAFQALFPPLNTSRERSCLCWWGFKPTLEQSPSSL